MAYEKQTWNCGDTITADKLNHMEDGIEEASSGGGTTGYECVTEYQPLLEESVTTVQDGDEVAGLLSYSQLINAETIRVTFDGTEYECSRTTTPMGNAYGGIGESSFDFSQYPFVIMSEGLLSYSTILFTETVGTYTVKIEAVEIAVTATECFEKAVESVLPPSRIVVKMTRDSSYNILSVSHTAQEIFAMLEDDEDDREVAIKVVNESDAGYADWLYLRERDPNLNVDDSGVVITPGHRFITSILKTNDSSGTLINSSVHYADVCYYQGEFWWVYQRRWSGRHN